MQQKAFFLPRLLVSHILDTEDADSTFLRRVGELALEYTAAHPRRQ
jgi:hypothetical protein